MLKLHWIIVSLSLFTGISGPLSRHMLIKARSEQELLIAEINPQLRFSAFLFLFYTWYRT